MSCRPTCRKRKRVRASLPQVCVRCGAKEDLTLDHIVPRVYGGTNERSNLQILCLPCNQRKFKGEVRHRDPQKNRLEGQVIAAALGHPRCAS